MNPHYFPVLKTALSYAPLIVPLTVYSLWIATGAITARAGAGYVFGRGDVQRGNAKQRALQALVLAKISAVYTGAIFYFGIMTKAQLDASVTALQNSRLTEKLLNLALAF